MPDGPPDLVFIDSETTGLDPDRDRVIELGAVRTDRRLRVVDRFSALVDPGVPLPLFVARMTGISETELTHAAPFADVYPEFVRFVAGATLVGHNIAFDLGLVAAEARRAGLPALRLAAFDTLDAALLLFPEHDRHALAVLAVALGVERPSHRALPDAETTRDLFAALCRRAAGLAQPERRLLEAIAWPPLSLLDVYKARPDKAPPPLVADEPGGARQTVLSTLPCDEDAWRGELEGDTADAMPRGAERAADRTDPPRRARASTDRRPRSSSGLAGRLEGFRRRPGQIELAAAVAGLLTTGGIGLFEAGTGMGKSLAYLLPAAHYSAARGVRVIVSTKTKALQRQLAAHELPLVEQSMPPGWRWALLMGRENYLCRRRLDEVLAESETHLPDPGRALALAYLVGRARWGEVDLSAIPYRAALVMPELADLGRELRSSASTCLGRRCGARTRCHWRLARARAERAHLVCVNHALLLTGRATLPQADDVIIDEAHLLPGEAMSAFSEVVDWRLADGLVNDLRGRHGQRPLAVRAQAAARDLERTQGEVLRAAAAEFERLAARLPDLALALGRALRDLALAARNPEESGGDGYNLTVWLTPGLREQPQWEGFAEACGLLAESLLALASAAGLAAEALPEEHRDSPVVRALAEDADRAAAALATMAEPGDRERVVWGEMEAVGRQAARGAGPPPDRWTLTNAPISPGHQMRAALWDRLRSTVLTSATLTVAGSYEYYRASAGLDRDLDVVEQTFPSPFDYRRQAVLVLETDRSSTFGTTERASRQAARLKRLTEVTGGRLLALFTNKREMEAVAAAVGAHAESEGVLVLAQGVHGSAATLAEEFKHHPATVLLGVDTLWTGQDFPGEALVCLVIAKLPFPRQDPLFHARRQAAEESGVDWFRSFYLPEAVLRFRQGFGRLIRTETDTGVVVVLDPRLTQKNYQREFLASLPEIEVVQAAPDEVADVVDYHLRRLAEQAGA